MKFKNHIFFMLGIASIFSLGYVSEVLAGVDCTGTVAAGTYCRYWGTTPDCQPGCYCNGGKKTSIDISESRMKKICKERNATSEEYTKMMAVGVYYCPNEKPYSKAKAKTSNDCFKDRYCGDTPDEGEYCFTTVGGDYSYEKCPKGCYCDGGKKLAVPEMWLDTSTPNSSGLSAPSGTLRTLALYSFCKNNQTTYLTDYLAARGVHYCPPEFPNSIEGAKHLSQCHTTVNGVTLYYRQNNCAAGTYLPKNTPHDSYCTPCPTGCNCPGGEYYVSTTADQGIFDCEGHPDSDSGQNDSPTPPVNPSVVPFFHRTEIDPYSLHAEMYCASGKIPCVAGSYLPAGGDSTDDCELCEPGFYCLAGCHTPNSNKDQTPKKCPVSKPNSAEGSDSVSDCYASGTTPPNPTNIRCDAGYYLPSGADSEDDCEWCEAGYMCPGNNLKYKCGPRGYSEGGASQCSTCPDGQMADNANKSCEDGLIEVQAGYYLRAGTIIPEPCPSTDKFCPGGRWKKYSEDQGAFKCPFDSHLDGEVSSDHQSCIIKLTPAQMVYGVDASRDGCLGYTNATNYQQCVWGDISFEVVNDTGIVYNENGDVNNPNASSSSSWNQNSSNTTNTFVQNDDAAASKRKQVDDTTFVEKDVANKYDVQYIPKEPLKTEKVTGSSTQPTQLMNVTKVSGSNSTVATVPVAARSARAPRTTRVKQPQRGVVKR